MDSKNNVKKTKKTKLEYFSSLYLSTSLAKTLYINTIFTEKCNYNCSYCFQKRNTNLLNLSIFEQHFKNIINYIKNKNIVQYRFSLIGGEISILPIEYQKNIFSILANTLKEIKSNDKDFKIIYVTNYSKDLTFLNDCEIPKNSLLDIAISHHPEYISYEDIFNKAFHESKKYNFNYTITIKTFSWEDFHKLKELNIKYNSNFNIEFGDKDWKIQQEIFNKNKKLLRPVLCYSYNYQIFPDGSLRHFCTNENIYKNNNYNFNSIIKCNQRCSNYEIENETYKKVRNVSRYL